MRYLRALFTGAIVLLLASCTAAVERAVGDWHGTIATPQGQLSIVVRIAAQNGTLKGTLESIDQAPGELIPIAITKADDRTLAFDVPTIKAAFTGTWDERTPGWSGTWRQSGFKFPVTLTVGPGANALKGLEGIWQANVVRGDTTRRIVLRIQTVAGNTTVKFDAPDAGASNLAVVNFTREGDRIRFEVPAAGARFDGALVPGAGRIEGTWYFQGMPPVRIAFVGASPAAPRKTSHPQDPRPPFPYRVEEVRIPNTAAQGVTLACTLTVPQGEGPFSAVALITGSGGQDRDETLFGGHRTFAVLADHLTRHGTAVLRCDDRGIALSTGAFETATTLDFALDANAAVAYLAGRRDIKKDAIGLVGHSEGGVVAVIEAGANPNVSRLVLLGTPGTNLRQVLLSQRLLLGEAQGLSMSWLNDTQPIVAKILDAVATAADGAEAAVRVRNLLTLDARAALRLDSASAKAFVQEMTNPWTRQILRLDIASYLSKVTVPVLALAGSNDCLVEPDVNLAALKSGLTHSPDLTLRKLDGLNHFFQLAKFGTTAEAATLEQTFDPRALDEIANWLAR